MINEVTRFESVPQSNYPVAKMRPKLIGSSVHLWLSAIIDTRQLSFVEREGFPGLRTRVDSQLSASRPPCGEGCRLSVRLEGVEGGIGEETSLRLRCPLISTAVRKEAKAKGVRCEQHQQRVARWFGRWVRETAQAINDTALRRSEVKRQLNAIDDTLRSLT